MILEYLKRLTIKTCQIAGPMLMVAAGYHILSYQLKHLDTTSARVMADNIESITVLILGFVLFLVGYHAE